MHVTRMSTETFKTSAAVRARLQRVQKGMDALLRTALHLCHGRYIAILMVLVSMLPLVSLNASAAVATQLAFILDGSESISDQDWATIREGLATAVENVDCMAQDGSVEITVIQFSASARVEIAPTVITTQNVSQIAASIRAIPQMRESTCISCGLCLAADTLRASSHFDSQVKQVLNLFTDGDPNVCACSDGTCAYEGSTCYFINIARADAISARDCAIRTLAMSPDQDHLDAEFLGSIGEASTWLRDSLVWPQPGSDAPPFYASGWLAVVDTTDELATVFCSKCGITTQPATLNVVNNVYGGAPSDSWSYSGPHGDFVIPPEGGEHAILSLVPGEYVVSQQTKPGYSCTVNGNVTAQATVTLQPGDSQTIIFTNTRLTPSLEIQKSVDNPTPRVGDQIVFGIVLANLGNAPATQVLVSDMLPSGYSYVSHTTNLGTYTAATGLWDIGTLPASSEALLNVAAIVQPTGERTNTASADWAENSGDAITATASTAPRYPSVTIDKTVNESSPAIGDSVVFEIEVANVGEVSASQVQVEDLLPSGYSYVSHTLSQGSYSAASGVWSIGELPPEGAATLQIVATVCTEGARTNTAQVDWAENPGSPLTASATTTPRYPLIGLSKSVSADAPLIGSQIIFSITVRNDGVVPASHVQVTDLLPSGYSYDSHSLTQGEYSVSTGMWSVDVLPAAHTATLQIAATVLPDGERVNVAEADWFENPGEPLIASAGTVPVASPPSPPAGGSSGGNLTPYADAGDDQVVCVGEQVYLDASYSYDPDGISGEDRISSDYSGLPHDVSDLSFGWSFSTWYYRDGLVVPHIPNGSDAPASGEGYDMPVFSFVPDLPGEYNLTVIVRDEFGAWSVDRITVRAVICSESFSCSYPAGLNLISLPAQPVTSSASDILDSLTDGTPPLSYHEDGLVVTDALSPLTGAWVHFSTDSEVVVVGRQIEEDVLIWLEEPGWHLISSPFAMEWEQVRVRVGGSQQRVDEGIARNQIRDLAICYDPADRTYRSATTLDPCHGYWVQTYVPDVLIVLPWSDRLSISSGNECTCEGPEVLYDLPPLPPLVSSWEPSEELAVVAYPNPAYTSVTLRLSMPSEADSAELRIYDLAGHVVLQRSLPSGESELLWDLRDEDGQRLGSGLYFLLATATCEDSQVLNSNVFRLLIIR